MRDLNVRRVEQIVAELTRFDPVTTKNTRSQTEKALKYATKLLTKALKTGVEIRPRKRGGGKIVIQYADAEELERLISELRDA